MANPTNGFKSSGGFTSSGGFKASTLEQIADRKKVAADEIAKTKKSDLLYVDLKDVTDGDTFKTTGVYSNEEIKHRLAGVNTYENEHKGMAVDPTRMARDKLAYSKVSGINVNNITDEMIFQQGEQGKQAFIDFAREGQEDRGVTSPRRLQLEVTPTGVIDKYDRSIDNVVNPFTGKNVNNALNNEFTDANFNTGWNPDYKANALRNTDMRRAAETQNIGEASQDLISTAAAFPLNMLKGATDVVGLGTSLIANYENGKNNIPTAEEILRAKMAQTGTDAENFRLSKERPNSLTSEIANFVNDGVGDFSNLTEKVAKWVQKSLDSDSRQLARVIDAEDASRVLKVESMQKLPEDATLLEKIEFKSKQFSNSSVTIFSI
jgi:hypothetical protein